MELEEQVVSLKLAKQLKDIGIKQDSYWKWENYSKNAYGYVKEWQLTDNSCLGDEINVIGLRNPKDYEIYAAFTVAELGGLLREYVTSEKNLEGNFFIRSEDAVYNTLENNEADARAKMLKYLLSNECNCDDLQFLKWRNSITNKRKMVTVQ